MAKAAAKTAVAKAPGPATAKGKGGKGGKSAKAAKPRTAMADVWTLLICIAVTVWAFKTIVALSAQSF
ncbi:MAG: hypothetical protein H7236_12240 [Gemmatimonadaceae bacterium]|nr:hypothetical protein [Caulobacter sp.]